MFTSEDLLQLRQKGISAQQVEQQLQAFSKGFPYLRLQGAASIGNGIIAPQDHEVEAYIQESTGCAIGAQERFYLLIHLNRLSTHGE